MEKLTERIRVDGMTCGSCARHVRQALENVEGVEIEEITIGEVEISYDPADTARQEIIEAIRKEGYGAE